MATTREEVVQAIHDVDARTQRLTAAIVARGDASVYDGGWTVRDALSHVAARSSGARMLGLLDTLRETGEFRRGVTNIDEINHGQVEERLDLAVPQLLEEIAAGHRAALAAIGGIEPELLAKTIPNFRGDGEMTVADLFILGIANHENNHLNDIERAVMSS